MNWLPLIIVTAQVTLVAALGLLAARLFSSAAHRHSVLLAALLCILVSPLFYAGVAGTGLSLNLPAVFPAPREDVAAAPLPSDLAPSRKEDTLPALPEPAEFPETGLPDSPARAVAPPTATADPIQKQRQVDRFRLRADYVVVVLWLAGTLLSLAGVLRSQLKTQFILKAAHPVGKGIDASVIAGAEKRLGAVGRLRVATTGKVAGPAVVGILQPWILIPARYLETLSRDELQQVLIHEGAHALRRDPLVALLQRIGGAMFWWHPLVHVVNWDLTRAREEVCDNFVLTHTEPETYGATLLRLATLSPAMARLPLAIGMFDGRGKLEERIRGLLDSRRQILTHVRFGTAATVLGAFALISVVVAAARVSAQNPGVAPPDAPPVAEKVAEASPAEAADAKEFRLILTYHGESDKPFYNLILNVPPVMQQKHEFFLQQQISEDQAGILIKHLKKSRFFEHAKVTKTQDDPDTGPQYLLRVRLGDKHYEETLGWNVGTIDRLDGIRKSLDGDAAKLMDQLLARLEGQRKVWESGEVINDLKTTLSAEKETFGAGQAIPIKLELTNVGKQDREYGHHLFIRSGSEIVVTDEHGRQVPYLGGGVGLTTRETTITPGETKVIESCDLSDFYYLRRPGLYTVAFRQVAVFKAGVPSSNAVRFRVTAGAEADGDPMGRLLPLGSRGGTLIGSPNATAAVRPGTSRAETPGYQFVFVGQNGGLKGVKGIKESNFRVWLWLTDKAAEAAEAGDSTSLPDSEYLGKIARWHAYFYASPEALEVWPTVKHDVTEAIKKPQDEKSDAASDDDYRLLHDRYRALILTAAKAGKKEEVAKLTDTFNESIGGKLLFVQVTSRVGPIADHATLFSKFFDPQRKIGIGKLNFAVSAKPIVLQNHDGQDVVLIATNPLGGNKWPDDLQVALVMDNVAKKDIRKPLAEPKWGEVMDGFRARLSAGKQTFDAAEPIPLSLEIENSGQVDKEYLVSVIPANQTVRVIDDRGRDVLPLLNIYQVTVGASRPEKIKAGRSIAIASFDLAESYYLRRPGRYKVSWWGKPASAEFEFEVAPNPARAAADGDPIGRLLPLVKEGWWLGAGPKGKFKPGSNWGETTGQIVRFVENPPAHNGDGFINLCLMDEPAAAIPVNSNSSIPTSEYLGKIGRWHVYYLASEIGLKTWPTMKEDIKEALAATPKVSIQIDAERAEFVVGEIVTVPITIRNVGKQDIKAPETYWSARVILDGKEYQRLAQSPWSGTGIIAPNASYSGDIRLSKHEFGIQPSALTAGEHKLALHVGNDTSNEVLFTILAERRKVSLKIDADRLTFGPAEDVTVMATIGNLGATNLEAPATYWAARVILDGKEYARQPKFIGDWNGPAVIIPNGTYRGGITLTEYGIDPATLKPGEHKLSLQLGDKKSNELTFHIQDPAQAAALLKTHLAEIAAIKSGVTREVLLKAFQPEGGLSTRARRRYAYRANPKIKVDVTFAEIGMPEEKLRESPQDQVITISEPILELPISDNLTAGGPKVDLGWSETVEGLKARLSVETRNVVEGATLLGVHLELQNASETRETKELQLDLENITFAVVDGEGKAVSRPQVIDYGGHIPGPWTVRLAPGGSQRVDITSRGLGIRPNLAAVLDLGATFAWEFRPEQSGPYYLQARLEIAKDFKQPAAWSGIIDLPKSKLPLPVKRTR